MSRIPEVPKGSGDSIKVGTTGTIGSLMTQELEKDPFHASSSSQNTNIISPVSVPCVYVPKRTQPRKNLPSETNSSINCKSDPGNVQKPNQKLISGQQASILSSEVQADKKASRNKPNKKGRIHIVEVVDIKCNNPMSSRLKKLGFSKLSETIG